MEVNYDSFPPEISDALKALADHYDYDEVNDRGANGYVVFGQNKVSKAHIAIKFYYGEPGARQHNEPRLLSAVRSANILDILDARLVNDEWAYFVTPRCFEGDVDDLLNVGPSVHRAVGFALGICSGVSTLHASRMVHRDLKPANIVITDGSPKIADFGSVRALEANSDYVTASRHSVLYRPPESFESGRYSVRGDVYQVGMVVYQLLGGSLPYDCNAYFNAADHRAYAKLGSDFDRSRYEDGVISRRANAGTLADLRSLPGWIDAGTKRAIRKMINPNPAARFASVADIAAELTSIRSRVLDWFWDGDAATLLLNGSRIELRPVAGGLYEAYRDNGSGFRRVPKVEPAPMPQVIEQIT